MDKIRAEFDDHFKSPYSMADFHFFFTCFWIVALIPTLIWWRESVLWVAYMSLWANVVSHATGYSAAKGEKQIQTMVEEVKSGES